MVWATSDTERPVPRYLFTCLQFTVPANPEPAVPSNSATPITSVPSFMSEPPCACAQPLNADRAASGIPGGCIATPRREGKLRRLGFVLPLLSLDTGRGPGVDRRVWGCGRR